MPPSPSVPFPRSTAEIRIRDPFIVADKSAGLYHLYSSSGCRSDSGYVGVEAYSSPDLQHWSAPRRVLELPPGEVAQVWAPEVHLHRGRWYLLTTLTNHDRLPDKPPVDHPDWPAMPRRGTHVFVSDHALGPFRAVRSTSLTPVEWCSLDGTLFVEDGIPYLVFCHEWIQTIDGRMMASRLSDDLASVVGEPVLLFCASHAPGITIEPERGLITDGPFLHRLPRGDLIMLWSTCIPAHGYSMLAAHSPSGRITGPWSAQHLMSGEDGGHGMLFRDFAGDLLMALHRPNHTAERLHLCHISWRDGDVASCILKPYGASRPDASSAART